MRENLFVVYSSADDLSQDVLHPALFGLWDLLPAEPPPLSNVHEQPFNLQSDNDLAFRCDCLPAIFYLFLFLFGGGLVTGNETDCE